jgi:TetR/AcrR family transcriptional regulator, transcriptional repressor for nem operon
MSRPTKHDPKRGDARTRLLEAARDVIRQKGFSGTSVEDICREAGVTKGAYFHHFKSKEELGIAAANFWSETTGEMFRGAPYHEPADPLERVLAYLEFRRDIIVGPLEEFTCLVGTMSQEVYGEHPPIRDACAQSIFSHAATLVPDIEAAIRTRGITPDGWTADGLARHTQAVLQGAYILAKASDNAEFARESINHLIRYVELLFGVAPTERETW